MLHIYVMYVFDMRVYITSNQDTDEGFTTNF